MTAQFARAPHQSKLAAPSHQAPHAALLIDFDNVTMGIRSDITKELKNLLNSDIIKGKVAVQRAYADWRRYPQYVVPLAEASVDLIFAPAYGSSKKNATDIRLSIDALELVFTRPEIGTFILLSGDSDFSSLVLKLKEYGKYVVGVGIRESASDLLVQNCDEYYSYSALTGLTRAGDEGAAATTDPWELVELAVQQMIANGDVMRSDRLKQVILELDANFDEKTLGFSKFNRFVSEAANRGVIRLNKLENGQFEIALPGAREQETEEPARKEARPARGRGRRGRGEREAESRKAPAEAAGAEQAPKAPEPELQKEAEAQAEPGPGAVRRAFDLLRRAAGELGATQDRAVRDSDVKRRMLDLEPEWDESAVGFSKFSRFLRHAHDAEVINLRKIDNGNYEVALPGGAPAPAGPVAAAEAAEEVGGRKRRGRGDRATAAGRRKAEEPEAVAAAPPVTAAAPAAAVIPAEARKPVAERATGVVARRGSKGRPKAGTPPLLEGQVVPTARTQGPAAAGKAASPLAGLDLPRDRDAVIEYLTKSYRGIGRKTAETLVDGVGADRVFETLHKSPDRVKNLVGGKRAETLIDAWFADYAARTAPPAEGSGVDGKDSAARVRRGGRRRGGRGRKRTPVGKE